MAVAAPDTAGAHVAAFLGEYVRQTKGRWAGAPLELEPWQRAFVDEAFRLGDDGVRVYQEAYLGIPRKNGKSTLASGIALYLLAADGENAPEVYAAAGSKDQARVVFDQAALMVAKSPRLSDFLRVQRHDIAAPFCDGVFKVIAADGDLQHGSSPSGSVIDELWAHKSDKLHTALTSGTGAREQPLSATITTAGYDLDTPLGGIFERAMMLGDVRRPAPFLTVCRDVENGVLFWWYGVTDADQGVDLDDPEVWAACNPASWITADYLRRERHKPSMRLNEFRRLHTCEWTEAEEAWIEPAAWDACVGDPRPDLADRRFVGVDIGRKKDSTAVVVGGLVDGVLHLRATIRVPSQSRPVAVTEARADVVSIDGEYGAEEVVYDPHQFTESAEILEERGLTMVEFAQTDARMCPASEALFELIHAGRVVHDGDPVFRSQMLAAVPSETDRGVRISKRKSKKRIDAAVSAVMVAHRAIHHEAQSVPFVEVIR